MSSERYVQDFAALKTLFKRFYKPLRAYTFRFVNDKDLSEDIVQDVFYELWKRRESIRFENSAVKSCLFRAVYTYALNVLNNKQQNICSLESVKESDILDQYVTSYMQNSEHSLLLKELEEEIMFYIKTSYYYMDAAHSFFNGMNAFESHLDYWTLENPNAANPRITSAPLVNNSVKSSHGMRNASYLRLKTATINYTLPMSFIEKFGMSSLRCFVSGQNLLTWTKLLNFDPESTNYCG